MFYSTKSYYVKPLFVKTLPFSTGISCTNLKKCIAFEAQYFFVFCGKLSSRESLCTVVEEPFLVYVLMWRNLSLGLLKIQGTFPHIFVYVEEPFLRYPSMWRNLSSYICLCGGTFPHKSVYLEEPFLVNLFMLRNLSSDICVCGGPFP